MPTHTCCTWQERSALIWTRTVLFFWLYLSSSGYTISTILDRMNNTVHQTNDLMTWLNTGVFQTQPSFIFLRCQHVCGQIIAQPKADFPNININEVHLDDLVKSLNCNMTYTFCHCNRETVTSVTSRSSQRSRTCSTWWSSAPRRHRKVSVSRVVNTA